MEPLHNLVLERFRDPESGLDAFLAIDSVVDSKAVGGVRILGDVTLAEVSHMSRTMTKKYLFSGIRCGGAKAGIVMPGGADRRALLLAFGRAIRPYIFRGFWPGTDLGSDIRDVRTILEGAGVPSFGGAGAHSDKYTAMGLVHSIDAALLHAGLRWSGLRFAIEGFGKVGSQAAVLMQGRGAKLVAFSNTRGSVSDPEGFDASECAKSWKSKGSAFINSYGAPEGRESLFGADCDLLVPAARCWSIHEGNFRKIRAKAIVGAANVPMSAAVEGALYRAGKTIVPDGIANCGGVAGLALSRYFGDEEIDRIFRSRLRPRVLSVLSEERPPSESLEALIRQKRQAAGPKTLDVLLNVVKYHSSDRLFGKAELLNSLFPSISPIS
ncbi:MAG TPA: Glu/Leu/Phe/Val dehydrogenase dimerization domain-containing protein [Candidatus Bilamarchaeum sp.]|nr:Glu/Leu/Phe/Val dehydrogenase dimerization domain-containing protein [Candidatus Bilamarchaeum sp.]